MKVGIYEGNVFRRGSNHVSKYNFYAKSVSLCPWGKISVDVAKGVPEES